MADTARIEETLRRRILTEPEVLLDDRDVMRALVGATERARGENVIDMRGLAMDRLEQRLARLEDTHQSALAAAYDNLAGMHAIHRAVLALIGAEAFDVFLDRLAGDVAWTLRVDGVRLILEVRDDPEPLLADYHEALGFAEPGFCQSYLAAHGLRPDRDVLLHEPAPGSPSLWGEGPAAASEAILRLDLGAGRRPAVLILAAEDAAQFRPGQGTDLLAFLGHVVALTLRRWLG